MFNSKYFEKLKINKPHGVMFHHFHERNKDKYADGSINARQFESILKFIGYENILPANVWINKAIKGDLKKYDVCITFDDTLKCQYEVALPILDKFNISAFWFVNSALASKEKDENEIYKFFYKRNFRNFDEFYVIFLAEIHQSRFNKNVTRQISSFINNNFMIEYKLLSQNEREYRFIRDRILSRDQFKIIMDSLFKKYSFKKEKVAKQLWMDKKNLLKLHNKGQVLGLHSHSHINNLETLDYEKQYSEFYKNKKFIDNICNQSTISASYPFGSYNKTTMNVLKSLDVKLSFRSNMLKKYSNLEIPRIDHQNILNKIN